jgi:hypothetical protein
MVSFHFRSLLLLLINIGRGNFVAQFCPSIQNVIQQQPVAHVDCPFLSLLSVNTCGPIRFNWARWIPGKELNFGEDIQNLASLCKNRPAVMSPFWLKFATSDSNPSDLPRSASHFDASLLKLVEMDSVKSLITELSTLYQNRFFNTNWGLLTAQNFSELYATVARCSPVASARVSANEEAMPQFNVVGRILGSGEAANQIILVGGHFDSGNFFNALNESDFTNNGTLVAAWSTRRAPGADDDLSGSITILELFRTLARSGFRPQRTIEFLAFAGEERGIFEGKVTGKAGSKGFAKRYASLGFRVVAMLNLDSIGKNFIVKECEEIHCHNIFNIQNDYSIAIFGNVSAYPQVCFCFCCCFFVVILVLKGHKWSQK